MAYHTRSKGTPLSPPSLKHKGKRKIVDENNIKRMETVEKEYLSNELALKLEQKMAKLEREVIGMRNWAKLSSMGNHATANQTILPNHPLYQILPINLRIHQIPFMCLNQTTFMHPNTIPMPSILPIPLSSHNFILKPTQSQIMSYPMAPPHYQTPYSYQMSPYQMPPPYQQLTYPIYKIRPVHFSSSLPIQQHKIKKQPNFEKKPAKNYTPLVEPIVEFNEKLRDSGHITPILAVSMATHAKRLNNSKICAYHSGMEGHTIEECRTLKDTIQNLIDTKAVHFEDHAPIVSNNPLQRISKYGEGQ